MRFWITFCFILWVFCGLLQLSCKQKKQSQKIKKENKADTLPKFELVTKNQLFANRIDTSYLNQKKETLQTLFNNYWLFNKVSGGIIIAKNGEILLEEYLGYSNKESKDTITANTPIHIASVSKVLTAMVVLKLVENHYLKLDDDVKTFYPKFPYDSITIENLLTHRSGLPNYAYFAADTIWNTNQTLTNQAMLNLMIRYKPEAYNLPGKHFSYSNTNYALLALIIERVTKKTYPQAMKEILFEPLGMKNTFVFNIKDTASVSQSYYYNGRPWKFNYLDQIYGDKNIYSTPRDLLKFDLAMYGQKFLPKKLKDLAFKGYSYESKGIKNYGLGIRMLEWDENKKLLYHNGWWHGNYSTFVHANRDTVSIIALGNQKIRSVYSAFNFVSIFGDYPIELDDTQNGYDEDTITIDSIKTAQPKKKIEQKTIKKDSVFRNRESVTEPQEAPF